MQDVETLITATNDKLDSFSGHSNNTTAIGDGSTQLRVLPLGYNQGAGQVRSLLCDAAGHQQIDVVSSTLPSGGATEAKQDTAIGHLATIASDTTSIDGKITACNTGAVTVSASALPSGAATQSTLNDAEVHLGSIDGKITACNTGAVTVSVSALPSGAATQSTLNDAEVHLGSIDGKITACNTGAVTVSASALPSGAATQSTLNDAEVHLGSIDGKITQGYDVQIASGGSGLQQNLIYGRDNSGNLDALKTDTSGHLEVVVDDFVKGQAAMAASFPVTIASNQSNLNVNANISGTVVDSNSGNKSAQTQRVVIADDDTNLSAIKAAVEIIDNAITGNEMQCDIIASLPAGVNAIGKLSANDGVDIGDVDVTSISAGTNRIGKVVLMGNEAADGSGTERHALLDSAGHLQVDVLSAPTTAVTNTTLTNLDNCIDTNELQVDIVASLPAGTNAIGKLSANSGVDIGDVDVTSLPLTFNSGNKDGTCQRVVIATDDVNMSAIKSSLDSLDNAVDGNYLNVNANIAGTDVDSNSGNKSAATQRVVVATDDVNLSAIKSSLTTIEGTVGSSKVNVNLASDAAGLATSSLQGDLNTKIDTIDSQIDLLEGANTIKDVEWLSSATILDQALSDVLDTEGYKNIFIYGENAGSISGNTLKIFGSNLSAGTYYSVGQMSVITSDSGRYLIREDTPLADMPSPRYLKVFNATGSSQTITKLRAVMSNKLRYV